MEFWGVEVKAGEPLKVTPGFSKLLHLSQASLGELKKKKEVESIHLSINVDGTKLPIGTLFTDKLPQQQFDLVFDRDFEISHNWKNGSVYFYGYKADNPSEDDIPGEFGDSDSDSEEEIPNNVTNTGEPASETKQKKPIESQKKVKIQEPKDIDGIIDDDSMSDDDDDDDDDVETDESDEETPKKDVVASKKRVADPITKTPVQEKKAKVTTPQKTDGKKVSGHEATPHPAKKAGKTTPGEKPNQSAPKSGGAHSCSSCKRNFANEKGLESHNKAKHSAGK